MIESGTISDPQPEPEHQPHPEPESESAPPSSLPATKARPKKKPRKSSSSSVTSPESEPSAPKPDPPPAIRIIPRPLSTPGELSAALRHLRAADPLLGPLIDSYQGPTLHPILPPFLTLTRSIIHQQLAFKAAASAYSRFLSLCGGHESLVVPSSVLSLSLSDLRQIGISRRKAGYLHDLARKFHTGVLSDDMIFSMDDKSVTALLTMVEGIGAWSVHMFLIFSLHRPDVLPVGDQGVRKGVQMLYGLDDVPRPSQMDRLCERWRPYRSVGSWYMWRLSEARGSNGTDAVPAQHQHQQLLLENVQNTCNLLASEQGTVSTQAHGSFPTIHSMEQ